MSFHIQRPSEMVGHPFRIYRWGNANSERQGDLPGLLILESSALSLWHGACWLNWRGLSFLSVWSINLKGKIGRTKKKKNLQKVVNTLQRECRDHLLNFCCWKWTLSFCRIFKSSWGYQVWQPLPKIKYQTSKHLTAQEPSVFLGCDVCQNCAWHFQAWKCLSTVLPFNPPSRALGLKD